jgi:isohexenylglutaconyl-CoA hydratase
MTATDAASAALPDTWHTLVLHREGPALFVTLNRPDVRNAMSLQMVEELRTLLAATATDESLRVIVLRGHGGHFCAGGDVKDMATARARLTADHNPYEALNRAFGHLISEADVQPQVVVCVLEGAVLGGGFGLACIADVALAHGSARFGLPETGLGVIPAQIAPFVVKRIGLTQARRLALTGLRIDAKEALRIGLIHEVADNDDALESALKATLAGIRQCAPRANRITKALLHRSGHEPSESLLDDAARQFAAAVIGEEAQEGTLAFVQKRPARWNSQEPTT